MIRAGIVGASGIAGGELARLILEHPDFELSFLGGSASAGKRLAELHPGLRVDAGVAVQQITDDIVGSVDVLFLATPAPVSAELAARYGDRIPVIVDLSGAFRISSPEIHTRWYPKVTRNPELTARFVYGVPELVRERLTDASLISLPGCYATALTLGLAPLVLGLGLELRTVVVDGKSGSSGGGLQYGASHLHPYRSGAITPYAPTGHRHAAEVGEFLKRNGGGTINSLTMSAYGVSHVRGLLTSTYAFTDTAIDQRELQRAYLRFYKGEQFVRVRRHDETLIPMPDPQAVLGSNYCDVTVLVDDDGDRIIVLSALDNLIKGAAGQAVQAANIRFALPEGTGLKAMPLVPA
ncbi:N-acetyl-gamma-glutamyl-phosphate reductase [Rhodococcus sp. NPDC057135]|uniref:N-acetyl-gamma-glutamyl-phosphate reductase n=1 Tax=Rhodococcus sp. NPDC057135 TaxID=3346028 RepID=UPI00362F8B80